MRARARVARPETETRCLLGVGRALSGRTTAFATETPPAREELADNLMMKGGLPTSPATVRQEQRYDEMMAGHAAAR